MVVSISIICSVVTIYKNSVDNSNDYVDAVKFNSVRSQMVDFPLKDYDSISNELLEIGVSENDFNATKSLMIADTDYFDYDLLNKISEIATENSILKKFDTGVSNNTLHSVFDNIMNFQSLTFQVLMIVLFVIILISSKMHFFRKLEVLFALSGFGVMSLYLLLVGRIPIYVFQSLLFALCFVGLTILFRNCSVIKTKYLFLVAGCLVFISLYSVINLYFDNSFYLFKSLNSKANVQYEQKIENDIDSSENAIFIWNVFSQNTAVNDQDGFKFIQNGKLLPSSYIKNNLVDGEWTYNQRYYLDYLNRINVTNPMKSLAEDEHTYYVSDEERANIVLTFLKEHYDENYSMVKVGEISEFPVWKFSCNEK